MNIRTPRSGQAARIAKSYLSTLGLNVTHSQALELIARLHGYTDNQAMQSDARFAGPMVLRADSSTEFTFVAPRQSNVWLTVENLSVQVKRDDEGVVVDVFARGKEDEGTLASTWAMYQDAMEDPDEEQGEAPEQDDAFAASDTIKARFQQSGQDQHDAKEALDELRKRCSDIFPDEAAMWAFLTGQQN